MDDRTPIAKNSLLLGALLTILGLGTFALLRFDADKWTALLPALFGILFLLVGAAARRKVLPPRYLPYAAFGLALLALLGTAGGLVKTAALLAGKDVDHPPAAVEQAVTAVLCLVFLTVTLRSYLAARRIKVGEGT